jgi:anti-anti-sigma factor
MPNTTIGERLVLCPLEPVVAGGSAEALERHLCQLYRSGYRTLVVDVSNVPAIDSAGIRALVRAHTTARLMNGTLRIAGAGPEVLRVMELTNLTDVFDMEDDSEAPSRATRAIAGTMLATALGTAIVWAGSSVWRRRKRA